MTKKFPALRVLVVEDELLIRWAIAETLTDAGHTVIEAEDGAAAVQALAGSAEPVDAVILDYRLPDSNDLTLLATHPQAVAPKPRDFHDGLWHTGSHQGGTGTRRVPRDEQAFRDA